jgi:signal transduction histidine kinase
VPTTAAASRCGALLLAVTLAAGCGTSNAQKAQKALTETAAKLRTIRSGTLDLRLTVAPRAGGKAFGRTLSGPFSLRRTGLPVVQMTSTSTADGRTKTTTVVSDGTRAFLTKDGITVELPPAQERQLRRSGELLAGAGGLAALRLGTWIHDPVVSDGGTVDGVETDRITDRPDVVRATDGLLRLAGLLGVDAAPLPASDRVRLRRAVRSPRLVLYTGKDDRLLRRLRLTANVAGDLPTPLATVLGGTAGGKLDLELDVSNPNERVTISNP